MSASAEYTPVEHKRSSSEDESFMLEDALLETEYARPLKKKPFSRSFAWGAGVHLFLILLYTASFIVFVRQNYSNNMEAGVNLIDCECVFFAYGDRLT
jgi:hypothetical protein